MEEPEEEVVYEVVILMMGRVDEEDLDRVNTLYVTSCFEKYEIEADDRSRVPTGQVLMII